MRLETDRIILRNFKEEDLEDFHEYCSQEGLGEMAGWKHHSDLSTSKEALYRNIKNTNIFAIEHKKDSKVIGHISINEDSEDGREDTKELGFVLNSNYHNKGIMTEALKKVIEFLFKEVELEEIYAFYDTRNVASGEVMRKSNMIYKGTFRNFIIRDIKYDNISAYSITKKEWEDNL